MDETENAHEVFEWAAPRGYSGDLLIVMEVDWGADNTCSLDLTAAGTTDHKGLRIALLSSVGTLAYDDGSVTTATAQAHSGERDTRRIVPSEDTWADWFQFTARGLNGTDTLTLAGFALHVASHPEMDVVVDPFTFQIACDEPFTVTQLQAGTHVRDFTQSSMTGTGASDYKQASINHQDGLSDAFSSEAIVLAVRGDSFAAASIAEVTLDHPDGRAVFHLTSSQPDADFRGPPGGYDLRVDRVGAGAFDSFWGFIGGVDEVAHLDHVVS